MSLPLKSPFLPMEAQTAAAIPEGPDWQYEPKWDGFRCIAFRDGAKVELQSKSGQDLTRYFPEVAASLASLEAKRFVLDGEIIVAIDGNLSFDDLLQRIHPAASRIKHLSVTTPASMVVFDLLVDPQGNSLIAEHLSERRAALEAFAAIYLRSNPGVSLSPATVKFPEARNWFLNMAGGLDGVIAKRLDVPYQSGERSGMLKIKNLRSADCVVGGFRYATKGKWVGSLLLGLYNAKGLLDHVGFTSSIRTKDRARITTEVEKHIGPPGFTGAAPGGPSRWSTERSAEWISLKPELVVEVQYDHFAGGRFRHGTKLVRWRADKTAALCTIDQVMRESRSPLGLLKAVGRKS